MNFVALTLNILVIGYIYEFFLIETTMEYKLKLINYNYFIKIVLNNKNIYK